MFFLLPPRQACLSRRRMNRRHQTRLRAVKTLGASIFGVGHASTIGSGEPRAQHGCAGSNWVERVRGTGGHPRDHWQPGPWLQSYFGIWLQDL